MHHQLRRPERNSGLYNTRKKELTISGLVLPAETTGVAEHRIKHGSHDKPNGILMPFKYLYRKFYNEPK